MKKLQAVIKSLILSGALAAAQATCAQKVPVSAGPGNWPTKAALLDAARQGAFNSIPTMRLSVPGAERDMAPFYMSIKAILHDEYGVPAFPEWPGSCRMEFVNQVTAIFQGLTAANLSVLSDRPPDFINPNPDHADGVRDRLKSLQRPGSYCDTQVQGQWKPHPYKAAVPKLLAEYGRALAEWIQGEISRRQTTYAAAQNLKQTEANDKATRQRAAEQQHIDAERARIEADQKRRQKDKARVAG